MAAGDGTETATPNRTTMERTSDRELVITRTFNGPARIVFDAWTRPELVRRWWAPGSRDVAVVSCDAEVRVGGRYRYVLRHGSHGVFAFTGTYREVTPHTRLVYTEMFEPDGQPAGGDEGAVVTVTFVEHQGRTHLTSHSLFPSKDVLDGVLATGMEGGMRETMEHLEALVQALTDEGRRTKDEGRL
jgi:uncharacterized protein YndB with AHSA1/START domain